MAHGTPQRAATLWLATLPGHRAEARWKSKSRRRPQTVTKPANAMRTRSGFRSQLTFVPQSPNGPAGLSLAGPYYFQPECALFETNKAAEGQKEAAGENDACIRLERVSPFTNAGFARMLERAGTVVKLSFNPHPHIVRHACGFALANRGHDTRALQAYLGHFQEFLARMTAPEPLASCFRTPHPKLRQSADPRCCWRPRHKPLPGGRQPNRRCEAYAQGSKGED
jgi:hypothetical protein